MESVLIDEKTVVLTGAGISVPSGIPAFRTGESAIWSEDTIKYGHYESFLRKPVSAWLWWLDRFGSLKGRSPNSGHLFLRQIQEATGCVVVTQNIDGLHAACRTHVYEVHGRFSYYRCTRRTCVNGGPRGLIRASEVADRIETFHADPKVNTLPKCPLCRKRLRPHVLFFEESYTDHVSFEYKGVARHSYDMSSLIIIGSTMKVSIAWMMLGDALRNKVPIYLVDPNPAPIPSVHGLSGEMFRPEATIFQETAESFLSRLHDKVTSL